MIECQHCGEWFAPANPYNPGLCPGCNQPVPIPRTLQQDQDWLDYLKQEQEQVQWTQIIQS